jgi:protein TonB
MSNKNPQVDLKGKYRRTLELGFVLSLLITLAVFFGFRGIELEPAAVEAAHIEIHVEDIPPTEQFKRPPPPPEPSVPVPTENENVPEDATIASTELDLSELPEPPAPPTEGIEAGYTFVPYDEAPQLIGGVQSISRNLVYPELARKAGVEAVVVVGVLIDAHGNPIKTQILKSSNSSIGFDEAAEAALMRTQWVPAKQRDHAVAVWVSVPIRFHLRETS